jgi:hypothetical protein
MEQIDGSETTAFKNQTPGIHPKDYSQYPKHGKSLKSRIQIHKSIIRPTVTYGCETWAMTVTEQNCLLVFERRVLRKIYGPTLDDDGTWRIKKTNEELEILI